MPTGISLNARMQHLSPQLQNEIIDVIGNGIISAKIISKIIETKIFSILADEVTIASMENLAHPFL